jgi:hypothetical protein
MTKTEYNNTIQQRLMVKNKEGTDYGIVTKYDEESFSLLWQGETHSGNYTRQELKKDKENSYLFVDEKRVLKPKE